jgi:RsiW-degrading membrane proteinase PrsW (M82 family)
MRVSNSRALSYPRQGSEEREDFVSSSYQQPEYRPSTAGQVGAPSPHHGDLLPHSPGGSGVPVSTADPSPGGRRRLTARLSWLLILVGGVIAYLVVLRTMVATSNVNFFPALLLIGAITVPVTVLVLAEGLGNSPLVPGWAVLLTAVVGGVVGVVAAGTLEYDTMRRLGAVPMLFVGVIEEAAKLIVPVLLYLLWRPTDPRGGVIIGVAAGTGFATLETMGYGFQALLASGNIAAVDGTLLLRGLLSPACHIAWTGMTVAMLWRIRPARRRGRAVLAFLVTYLAAVVLHATWDGSSSLAVHVVVAVIGLVVLVGFIVAARRGRGPLAHH